MYLSYVGIRVTNMERSLKFYTRFFGLKEIVRGDNSPFGGGVYALLRDEMSGQRLELNWYPPTSPYGGDYVPGEGLDHVAFKVDNVPETLKALAAEGVEFVEIDPKLGEPNPRGFPGWFEVAYVKDSDGNWIELYQHAQPIRSYDPNRY